MTAPNLKTAYPRDVPPSLAFANKLTPPFANLCTYPKSTCNFAPSSLVAN